MKPTQVGASTALNVSQSQFCEPIDNYTGLPKNVPKLGPPLPGDLGRPILAAQGQLPQTTVDPEQQRVGQEREAARMAKLFASTNVHQRPAAVPLASASGNASTLPNVEFGEAPPIDPNAIQNMQDRKLAFVNAPVDRRTVSSDRLAQPASRYILQAGAVIPASLVTGIRSDLPGQIAAQVTENVYDSPTGRILLIPQGSRLIGDYDDQVGFGQRRVLLAWTRLILPDGRSIVLEREPAGDAAGFAGLEDRVDEHWGALAKAAGLSTLLSFGAQLAADDSSSELIRALRDGGQNTLNQAGQEIVRRQLNVPPTLTVRPGFPVRILVSRDVVLEPWRGAR